MKELVESVSGLVRSTSSIDLLQLDENLIDKHVFSFFGRAVAQKYEDLAGKYIKALMSNLSREGWPAHDLPRNAEVFSKFVKPAIGNGEKVAYLIDSLRYELAVELKADLERKHMVSLETVSAIIANYQPWECVCFPMLNQN